MAERQESDDVLIEYRVMPGSGKWVPYEKMRHMVSLWAVTYGGPPAVTISKRITTGVPVPDTTPTTDQQPETAPADRRARWEAAAHAAGREVDCNTLGVYMAVADAEQAALRAEVEGLDEALRGAIAVSEKDGARLRSDRAAVLREAADRIAAGPQDCKPGCCPGESPELLRLLADEAAKPEPGPADGQQKTRLLAQLQAGLTPIPETEDAHGPDTGAHGHTVPTSAPHSETTTRSRSTT